MSAPKHSRLKSGNMLFTIGLLGLSLLLLRGLHEETASAAFTDAPVSAMHPQAGTSAVAKYGPALAVRASGCLTCHAEVYSPFITDFGYGDPYFFGNPQSGSKVGPFNGSIYGDFPAESGKTGWLTARFHKEIIVPRAPIDFSLSDAASAGLKDQPPYREAFGAASLAEYLQVLENRKTKPSTVVEKKTVYIGAPDSATLEMRFGIEPGSSTDFKYVKSDPGASPEIEGIGPGGNGKYYTNTSDVVCDGDLFIGGTLLLDRPSIRTVSGCRIYATGPIFLQGAVTYRDGAGNADRSNLQLVSAQAIFLGTGRKKCGAEGDPLATRLLQSPALTSIFTRSADSRGIKPETFMRDLYDEASPIPLEDSSCHDDTLSFSRMLLDAPVVQSRYSGKFRGVVIAEFALFWQGKSSYEFDPVFKEVPVLPVLKESDYLLIEP
jgi:hypothetical protein